jgi:hypothetical protein
MRAPISLNRNRVQPVHKGLTRFGAARSSDTRDYDRTVATEPLFSVTGDRPTRQPAVQNTNGARTKTSADTWFLPMATATVASCRTRWRHFEWIGTGQRESRQPLRSIAPKFRAPKFRAPKFRAGLVT